MTSFDAKKAFEREMFLRAQPHVDAWAAGTVDDRGEAPDLVVDSATGTYGVEVTSVIRPEAKASIEARRVISAMAKAEYVRQGGREGLQVTAVFNDHAKLRKRDFESLASELVQIVIKEVPNGTDGAVRLRLQSGPDFRSNVFATVWLHETPMITRSDWRTANAFWTPVLRISEIQAELERKELRLPKYRRRAKHVWLLLIADGFDGSSSWSVEDAVYRAVYTTKFDGVVLYEQVADRATTLAICPPSAANWTSAPG